MLPPSLHRTVFEFSWDRGNIWTKFRLWIYFWSLTSNWQWQWQWHIKLFSNLSTCPTHPNWLGSDLNLVKVWLYLVIQSSSHNVSVSHFALLLLRHVWEFCVLSKRVFILRQTWSSTPPSEWWQSVDVVTISQTNQPFKFSKVLMQN